MPIRISTNPLKVSEKYYLLFYHRKFVKYRYAQDAILIDTDSLLPQHITKLPLFEARNLHGRNPVMLYFTNCVLQDNKIFVFYGEADSCSSYLILDHDRFVEHIINKGTKL